MRLNKFVAQATGLSRRAADQAISQGRVVVSEQTASLGQQLQGGEVVSLDGQVLRSSPVSQTILLHKPVGYVCSRRGQGSRTIYDLLPPQLHHLKPVGRLDKDSSGLLLLTNDGQLANRLSHPRYRKTKVYQVGLDKPLQPDHLEQLKRGVMLDDGPSHLVVKPSQPGAHYQVSLHQGRNRQIRRTFAALGYSVKQLHRTTFGPYHLSRLPSGQFQTISPAQLD